MYREGVLSVDIVTHLIDHRLGLNGGSVDELGHTVVYVDVFVLLERLHVVAIMLWSRHDARRMCCFLKDDWILVVTCGTTHETRRDVSVA